MRVFTNIDTIGEETNLQEDVVIAMSKKEAQNLLTMATFSKLNTETQLKLRAELRDILSEVLS